MKSSRWTLFFAAGIVGFGIIASGVAFLATRKAEPAVSLSFVPSSATLVGQADIRSLASSPLGDALSRERNDGTEPTPADAIFEAVGIDVFRDLDFVTFSYAGSSGEGKRDRWGFVATGNFDTETLVEKLTQHELETEEYAGTRIYRFVEAEKEESAMAVTGGGSTLLLGETSYLREMLDTGNGKSPSAAALIESFGPDSFADQTFWVAGSPNESLFPFLGDHKQMPPLESFALSGRLDTELTLRARGRASDSDSAQKLVDVVRGLVALARLSAGGSKPELASLAEAVAIDRLDRDIEIHLSVPYETIRKLAEEGRKPAAEESPSRR